MAPKTPPLTHWSDSLKESEGLDALMAMIATMSELYEGVVDILKIHVIVDTNIIVADLSTIVRKKSTGARRPAIMELLAKGVLVGYFPREKISEVNEKCHELAERYDLSLTELLAVWKKYQEHLHIVPTSDLERERADSQMLAARDVTDVPFASARHIVGASVVLTNDRDLKDSGVPVMPWSQVLIDLRHHARHEGLKAALFIGAGTAVVVPVVAVLGLANLMYKAAQKLPPKVLLVAAAGFGIALLFPQSRKFLVDAGKALLDNAAKLANAAAPILNEMYEAGKRAGDRASEMRPALQKGLGKALARKITLTQAVYRVCLTSSKPLTVLEIQTLALREGAKIKAKQPANSVLRALRRHPLLVELPDGRWQPSSTYHTAT